MLHSATFRTTGIYPFNHTAVKTIDSVQTLHQSTGLLTFPCLVQHHQEELFLIYLMQISSSNSDEDTLQPGAGNESDDLQPHHLLLNEIEVPLTQFIFSRFYPNCRPKVHLMKKDVVDF